MSKPARSNNHSRRSRKLFIQLITLCMPLIILLSMEGLLRLFSYGDNLELFIQNPEDGYDEYLIVNPEVGKKYFQRFEITSPPNDIFLKKKEEGSFRIFVMGSSTVIGFPYDYNLMFSRILHKRLQDAYPGRQIEVVNTALTAINSYTLRDYGGQILKEDPDAVLVYAGHNEFYGAFGIGSNESMSKSRMLTRLHLMCMDLRFYQLFRQITSATIGKIGSRHSEQVQGTLMKRIVANKDIPFGGSDYSLAMERYRQNMEDLVRMFRKKGVPVFLSEVVSNDMGIEPLSHLSTGLEDEAYQAYKTAKEAFEKGSFQDALRHYIRARELDGIRFRATGEVNGIIGELASVYGAYRIPMQEIFQSASPHGIIGNSLMTEHVHPNIEGSFLMADAFFTEIIQSGMIGKIPGEMIHPAAYCRINWGYTPLDSLLAHHRVENLKTHWPFVPADAAGPDYRQTYRPVSKLDSIAFVAMADPTKSLYDMRLDLARDYTTRGDHRAAYWEYEAILRTNPYLPVNYRDAASSLLLLGDLPLALSYFKKSQEYEPSFYASYRMGEIYLIKGDFASARASFETAFSITTDNDERIRTLGKLYMACVYGDQEEDARAIATQLQKYDAGQYLRIPRKRYTYLNHIPFQTIEQVRTARRLISGGDYQGALPILENSLKIYDSHVVRRLLGEVHMQLEHPEMALYHLERVYGEFAFDPQFMAMLIRLNLSLNELQRAKALYGELKKMDPGSETLEALAPLF